MPHRGIFDFFRLASLAVDLFSDRSTRMPCSHSLNPRYRKKFVFTFNVLPRYERGTSSVTLKLYSIAVTTLLRGKELKENDAPLSLSAFS